MDSPRKGHFWGHTAWYMPRLVRDRHNQHTRPYSQDGSTDASSRWHSCSDELPLVGECHMRGTSLERTWLACQAAVLRARTIGRYWASCVAVKSLPSCVMFVCRFTVRGETVPRNFVWYGDPGGVKPNKEWLSWISCRTVWCPILNSRLAYVWLTCHSASMTDTTVVYINCEILNSKFTAKFLYCYSFTFLSLKIL